MDAIRAVCKCKDYSENELVLAVKRTSFQFITEWGFFTILFVITLTILTGGLWLAVILGWKLDEIIGNNYSCQFCNTKIDKKNFR